MILDGFYGLVEVAELSQLFAHISQLVEMSQFLMLNPSLKRVECINMRKKYPIALSQNGTSIIEVMIAVVFIIIMVGGLNYFTLPKSIVAREKIKRLAFAAAQQRMETLLELDYTAITADSNETSIPVTLATRTGLRNTTVTEGDPADGQGGGDADTDPVDYKKHHRKHHLE